MRNVDTDVLLSAFHRAWQRYTETSATVDLVRLSECIKAQGSTPAAEAALAAAYETLFLADERFRIRPICCFFEHKLHLYADDEELFAAWLEVACRLARIGNSDIRNSLIFWAFHRNRLRWRMKSGRAYTLLAPGARELRGELLPSLDREELIYAVRLCLDAASNKLNEDDFIIDDFLSFACVDLPLLHNSTAPILRGRR